MSGQAGATAASVVRPFAVFDIDGVLADVRHRLHHLAARPKNWDAFFAAADHDELLDVGAEFARRASETHRIVYLTGRPDRLRQATQGWLGRHALPAGPLLMRREGDRRPAAMVKVGQLRRLRSDGRIDLVVDDDPQVIEAARAAGFTARLADWMAEPSRRPIARHDPTLFDLSTLHEAQQRDGRT